LFTDTERIGLTKYGYDLANFYTTYRRAQRQKYETITIAQKLREREERSGERTMA
jgi:hypothetical protein